MKSQMHSVSTISLSLLFASFLVAPVLFGQEDSVESAYREIKQVNNLTLTVPTVVEVPFEEKELLRQDFAVKEINSERFVATYFYQDNSFDPEPTTLSASYLPTARGDISRMADSNSSTFDSFLLPQDGTAGKAVIYIRANSPITSSRLFLQLDNYVANPNTVGIEVENDDRFEAVVAPNTRFDSSALTFPKTTARVWRVTFSYIQPLRISELRLIQENTKKEKRVGLRFLAQPGESYRVYFNPDRYVALRTTEAGNLRENKGVKLLSPFSTLQNSEYRASDQDSDGVFDTLDNCVSVPNADQIDDDKNGRGDVCDDFDRDGVINVNDNCPNEPNRDQEDSDGDGVGDVCDKEESRLTEKYTWVPWFGMGIALVAILALFGFSVRSMRSTPHRDGTNESQNNANPTVVGESTLNHEEKKEGGENVDPSRN